jgi:hypothetical protein
MRPSTSIKSKCEQARVIFAAECIVGFVDAKIFKAKSKYLNFDIMRSFNVVYMSVFPVCLFKV